MTDEQTIRKFLRLMERDTLLHDADMACRAAVAALDRMEKRLVEADEIYTDENHVDWQRPTAWAYAQACKALDAKTERIAELERQMGTIAEIGGNLPDDRLTTRTGPNDAKQRGLMYCEARRIARELLEPPAEEK